MASSSSKQEVKQESTSALDVNLHPLVLINISDHFTRARVQSEKKEAHPRVIGALYGTQEGRKIEIKTSFEFVYVADESGVLLLDTEYIKQKKQQYEQVFKQYEVLGWYSTTDDVQPGDQLIHEQVMQFNDSPLYLTVSTKFGQQVRELPASIYESTVNVTAEGSQITWSKLPFKIETEESERIGLNHISNVDAGGQASSLVPQFASMFNAVQMLKERVQIVVNYLELVNGGKVPQDQKLLRQISSLSHRLPTIDSSKFMSEYTNEVNESLMVTYLAAMTKGTNQFNELIDKFNTTYDRRGRRGGMF